jgi:hypothetical protein
MAAENRGISFDEVRFTFFDIPAAHGTPELKGSTACSSGCLCGHVREG